MKLVLLSILFIISCSSPKKDLAKVSVSNECDKIFKKESDKRGVDVLESISQGAGVFTSYTLSGIGYTGDLVMFSVGGVITPAAVCSPLYPLAQHGSGNGLKVIFRCWLYIGDKVYGNVNEALGGLLGANIYQATEDMRCPDLKWIEKSLKKVAQCHKDKGDLIAFERQLEVINDKELKKRFCNPKLDINSM